MAVSSVISENIKSDEKVVAWTLDSSPLFESETAWLDYSVRAEKTRQYIAAWYRAKESSGAYSSLDDLRVCAFCGGQFQPHVTTNTKHGGWERNSTHVGHYRLCNKPLCRSVSRILGATPEIRPRSKQLLTQQLLKEVTRNDGNNPLVRRLARSFIRHSGSLRGRENQRYPSQDRFKSG